MPNIKLPNREKDTSDINKVIDDKPAKTFDKSMNDENNHNNSKKYDKSAWFKAIQKIVILIITVAGLVVSYKMVKRDIVDKVYQIQKKNDRQNKKASPKSDSAGERIIGEGYEFFSATLTIKNDSVMTDYPSAESTPWYELKDKIRFITIEKDVTKIGAHSFENYPLLRTITISESVKNIGTSAFSDCIMLERIQGILSGLETIDNYAFKNCSKLETIPGYTENKKNFTPMLKKIGVGAFENCKSLEIMKLPEDTYIDNVAFKNHNNIFTLICTPDSNIYKYAQNNNIFINSNFGNDDIIAKHNLDICGTYYLTDCKNAETSTIELKENSTVIYSDGQYGWWHLMESTGGTVHMGIHLPNDVNSQIYFISGNTLVAKGSDVIFDEIPKAETFDKQLTNGHLSIDFKSDGSLKLSCKSPQDHHSPEKNYSGTYTRKGDYIDIIINNDSQRYYVFAGSSSDPTSGGIAAKYYTKQ